MKKIGIVSCDKWINKITEDKLILESLIHKGYDAEIISWENQECDYKEYSALILRSVWGYQNKYEEFKKWLLMIKNNNILLFNSPDIILNNIRKDKQFEILTDNNIPLINTSFIYHDQQIECEYPTVIKPIISGSGENTFLINNLIELKEVFSNYEDILNMKDNGIMVQPYLDGIKNGEYSCIYIDGINTHNMLRFPGIFFEKKKALYVSDIPGSVKEVAESVSKLEEFKEYLYMRIDVVLHNGKPIIMEVELAEPDLLFKYLQENEIRNNGIDVLTNALVRRIKS